jgi:hypothetical protein
MDERGYSLSSINFHTPGVQPTVTESLSDRDQLQANLQRLEVINPAISTLDAEILKQSSLASAKMIESQMDEIKRLGKRFAEAFLATRDTHLEYETFVNRLEDAGGNVSALRISPAGLVNPSERNSIYAYGARELSEAGFLPNDVQKVL